MLNLLLITTILADDDQNPNQQAGASTSNKKFGNLPEEKFLIEGKGAVAANSDVSARAGMSILKQGGSAADAAIVTMLTEGLCNPHSMGVGGGFLLTYYDKSLDKVEVLNAREFAPEKAHCNMFENYKNYHGGLTVGVPGELMGYWELHKKYGKLPWKDLFQPAIDCCKNGIIVTKYFAGIIEMMRKMIFKTPSLKSWLVNDNDDLLQVGQLLKRLKLGETLEKIAEEGPDVLYNGTLTDAFVQDIQAEGGIITRHDLELYRPTWMAPEVATFPNNLVIYSTPTPGSGCVLLFILQVIFGFKDIPSGDEKWFRIVETWKHAFGFRCQLDGPTKEALKTPPPTNRRNCADPIRKKISETKTTSEDVNFYTDKCFSPYFGGGTCHICVLAPNGDAVSVTSSINSSFGANFVSPSTGIILNNHMMDFNISDNNVSKCNKISPNKQPLSSMVPTIILDEKTRDVRLIVGCAGGPKIITSTSQIILENLLYNVPLEAAISKKRLHHQLIPMVLFYEEGFSGIEQLRERGHVIQKLDSRVVMDYLFVPGCSSTTVIGVEGNEIQAFSDLRRNGFAVVFSV